MNKISRRRMLSAAGLVVGADFVLSSLRRNDEVSCCAAPASIPASSAEEKPFPRYVPISPDKAAALAYEIFPEGACMYAALKSAVTLISEQDPSAVPPMFFDMFKYGHGGCGMWGTLCGGCNGGAAVIGLFHQNPAVRDKLIAGLFRWYESTPLPQYIPSGAENDDFPVAAPQSVLCHVSTNSWCKATGEELFGAKRKERCRRMTADVAAKVVQLLNDQYTVDQAEKQLSTNQAAGPAGQGPAPQSCIQCHSTPGGAEGSRAAEAPKSIAKMDCATCHDMAADHPK